MCEVCLCETLIWNRITWEKRQGMKNHFAVMNNGKSGSVLEPSDTSGGSFGEPVLGCNFRSSLKDLFCQPFLFLFSYLYPLLLKLARVDSGFRRALTNFRRWMTWRQRFPGYTEAKPSKESSTLVKSYLCIVLFKKGTCSKYADLSSHDKKFSVIIKASYYMFVCLFVFFNKLFKTQVTF